MEDTLEQKDARRHQILGQGNGWLSGFINKMNQEKQPPMETAIPAQQTILDKPMQPLQRMFSLGDTKPTTTSTSKTSKSDTSPQHRRLSIPTSICHYNTDEVIDEEDAMSRDDEDQSVLSEVTLMTYSDEKANMIKEEFYNRMRQQTRELSMEEKQTLLREVQNDQEEKFKFMDHMQKKRQQKEKEHTREKSDERMRRISSKQHLSKNDEELQSSFTSTKTTKHRNSIDTESKDRQVENTTDEVHSIRHGIDDVIELKVLVANQQETIDTLSTKLHNLDVLSKRTLQEEQARIQQLEDEKLNLIKQLRESKDIGDSKNQELQDENIELKRQLEQMHVGDRLKESNSTMQTTLTADASWRSSRSTRSSSDA